jgi:hypothetical protein
MSLWAFLKELAESLTCYSKRVIRCEPHIHAFSPTKQIYKEILLIWSPVKTNAVHMWSGITGKETEVPVACRG